MADWLERNRVKRYEFAARIGVRPSVVTDYCAGTIRPGPDAMENIIRETNGAVDANDFVSEEARAIIASADAAGVAQ